ncbi:hypothetical protein GCM10009757_08090 [Streptomyces cheonanensis]|uniref:Carrier domain-containing protein n=1 Tax=Streptomyces cheonanensis TaxID=312720 RepID=A0ABP5GD47_9ACTN|nr:MULTISPECIES: condensation domain-containing protein [Streptomyces]
MAGAPLELPSSPGQEALWWVQHRSARKDMYNLTWRLRPAAPLDGAVLCRAWALVVERHEALRTALVPRDGAIAQRVHATVPADVQEVRWHRAPAGGPEPLLAHLAAQLHAEPFDLASAPLARLTLAEAGGVQELQVTVHHAILDGWALHLVLADLDRAITGLTTAAREGTDPAAVTAGRIFPDPPVTSRAFTEHARRPAPPAGLDHWRTRLRHARAVALHPDTPGHAGTGADGAVLRHRLSEAAATAAAEVARRIGSTLFAVQIAAVRCVLAAGGARGRTALGVVVANRMTARDQEAVGYLAHNVLFADTVEESDTLDTVAARARDALWESLPHQGVGHHTVFDALPADDAARLGAMPPVLLTHHGLIGSGLRLGGHPARLLPSPSSSARCQLVIGLLEEAGGTVVEIEYAAGRLTEATVRDFLADLEDLLRRAARPDTAVRSLPVRSRAVTGPAAVEAAGQAAVAAPGAGERARAAGADAALLEIWSTLLGRPVRPGDDFFQLGGHSLQVLSLVGTVEERTGRQLEVTEWLDHPTPARMAELLGIGTPPAPVPAPADLRRPAPAPGPDTPRRTGVAVLREGTPGGRHLHLLHGAGTGRLAYRELAAALPADWRVTVQEDDGDPAPTTVDALADRYARDLAAAAGGPLPDVLGGWSMGGLLAHAVAVRLERAARTCPPLLLLDPPAPDAVHAARPADFVSFTDAVLAGAGERAGALRPDLLTPGAPPEREARLVTALLRAAGEDARADALAARAALHRRHTAAMAGHLPAGPVAAPALLVTAEGSEEEVRQWAGRFTAAPRVVRLPADHHGLLRGAAATEIARLTTGVLTAVAG